MGTCLSTQSTTRRTRRRVSISPATAGEQGNNCGGRSGDDSVSQQQGGSSDSVTSTSPAPGGSGPSKTARGGGGDEDGERFRPQSGQEWAGVEQSSPPLLLSPSDRATSLSSNSIRDKASSNNPLSLSGDGVCGGASAGAQGLLPMTHTRLSSPLVTTDGDIKQQQSKRKHNEFHTGQQDLFSPTPPSNTDDTNNIKENSLSNSHATNTDINQSNVEEGGVAVEEEEEEGEAVAAWTLTSSSSVQQVDPRRLTVAVPLPTSDGHTSMAMHIHHPHLDYNEVLPNEVQDGNRLTLDQLSLKSVEDERLDVSSVRFATVALVDLSAVPEKTESAAVPMLSTAICNGTQQPLIGASLTSSGMCSSTSSGGGGGGGGDGSGGGGETGSRVVFCSSGGGGGSSFGHHQRHHRHHSSPFAMTDVLRTNNPSGGSPSTTMLPGFESSPNSNLFSEATGGGVDDGSAGGGGGGSGGASAHGDPQLGRSMYSSWDSSDCCRAEVSAANTQTTMQTVATASLFASRTF